MLAVMITYITIHISIKNKGPWKKCIICSLFHTLLSVLPLFYIWFLEFERIYSNWDWLGLMRWMWAGSYRIQRKKKAAKDAALVRERERERGKRGRSKSIKTITAAVSEFRKTVVRAEIVSYQSMISLLSISLFGAENQDAHLQISQLCGLSKFKMPSPHPSIIWLWPQVTPIGKEEPKIFTETISCKRCKWTQFGKKIWIIAIIKSFISKQLFEFYFLTAQLYKKKKIVFSN